MNPSTCRARRSYALRPARCNMRSILQGTVSPGDPESLLHVTSSNPSHAVQVWFDCGEHSRWLTRCQGSEAYCRRVFERMVSTNLASSLDVVPTETKVRLFHRHEQRTVAQATHYERAS